jgi:hypothetical protein
MHSTPLPAQNGFTFRSQGPSLRFTGHARLREQPDERREPERPLGTQVFAHLHLATNLAGTLSSFMKKPALAALKKVGPQS